MTSRFDRKMDQRRDTGTGAQHEESPYGVRSALPQFAIDAANRQVARVSGILNEAADSIDGLAGGEESVLPAPIRGFAASASDMLRDLAERAEAQDAGRLVQSLQRQAAASPMATASIGAAIGALLGLALIRLGPSADDAA